MPNNKDFYISKINLDKLPALDYYSNLVNSKVSEGLDRYLPVYFGKLLIIKRGNTLILINRYFDIIKGSWESRVLKFNKRIKRFKKEKNHQKSRLKLY
eukprot:UN28132